MIFFLYLMAATLIYSVAAMEGITNPKVTIIFRFGSAWIGAHYSSYNKRWCINLVPFLTICLGKSPEKM